MNKIFMGILFLSIFSANLYSQIGMGEYFKKWEGTYECSYEVTGGISPGIAKEILTIKGIHKNMYLQFNRIGWMTEDSAVLNWSDDEFLTVDLEKTKIAGVWIDDNGSGWLGTINGDLEEGNKISYLIKSNKQTFTETWELKDNTLRWEVKSKDKETGKDQITEALFKKRK